MAKIHIFLLTLLTLASARKIAARHSPAQEKQQATVLQLSRPILFEELQSKTLQFVEKETNVPRIFEYSCVQTLYPHADTSHQQNELAQKLANNKNASKTLIEKQGVIQQAPIQHIRQKMQEKNVSEIKKDDSVYTINKKRQKEAQKVASSGPSSLRLRMDTKNTTAEGQTNYLFDYMKSLQGFQPNQSVLIVILVLFLAALLFLLKCCKDSSQYQQLSPNDQQSQFAS